MYHRSERRVSKRTVIIGLAPYLMYHYCINNVPAHTITDVSRRVPSCISCCKYIVTYQSVSLHPQRELIRDDVSKTYHTRITVEWILTSVTQLGASVTSRLLEILFDTLLIRLRYVDPRYSLVSATTYRIVSCVSKVSGKRTSVHRYAKTCLVRTTIRT